MLMTTFLNLGFSGYMVKLLTMIDHERLCDFCIFLADHNFEFKQT